MEFREAKDIIKNGFNKPGFMVHFEWKKGCILTGDYFPAKYLGEPLIESEREAWELARQFAAKTQGKCVNIYVIRGDTFTPVTGYETHRIENR